MKSSSGRIIINNINQNKDIKDNTIQVITRKSSNNIRKNLNISNKFGSILTNRIFLKKHIIIESKNKNIVNDTRKNNNSINSSNQKNINDGNNGSNSNNNINNNYYNNNRNLNFNNNINLQIKDKNSNFNNYNQISNYQNIFNGVKFKSKNLVLREVFNNKDI